MRTFLLALPLASLLFAAGCSCAFKEDCNVCTSADEAASATQTVAVRSGEVLTMEEYQKLLAQGKITPLPEKEKVESVAPVTAQAVKTEEPVVAEKKAEDLPVVEKQEVTSTPKAEKTKAQKVATRKAAPTKTAVRTSPSGIRLIPGMPLPEGWNYIREEDLSGGVLKTAHEPMFSQADTNEEAES